MNSKMTLITILIMLLLGTCGKKKDDKTKDGDTPDELKLTPFEQISADWEGSYKSLDDGKPVGEPSFAKVTFTSDRTFKILVEGETTGQVEGYWNEFQGENLILRISGSNVSRIGTVGKIVEPIYELIGPGLRIMTASFELNLSKKNLTPGGNEPGDSLSRFSGTWTCDDGASRKTKLVISDSDRFQLSSVRNAERIFTAEGKIIQISPEILKLSADSTSDPLTPNSYFELRASDERVDLSLNRPGQAALDLGACIR